MEKETDRERLARLEHGLRLIANSGTFAGGPYAGELERIARRALAGQSLVPTLV